MSLDERIHELYTRLASTKDPDELCQTLGLLRAALHAQIEYLTASAADVLRTTSHRTATSRLTDPSHQSPQRKLPASDYSAA
jgi:hypothetical protein